MFVSVFLSHASLTLLCACAHELAKQSAATIQRQK
jgi:hypothetical protein